MAALCRRLKPPQAFYAQAVRSVLLPSTYNASPLQSYRGFRDPSNGGTKVPNFAFAFDIDGVLMRGSEPMPIAQKSLLYLQKNDIPFVLLTNGGGKHESERVSELSDRIGIPLLTNLFVQSHTPFAEFVHGNLNLEDEPILVIGGGGEGEGVRDVAEKYGFLNVITPADVIAAHPGIWPFSHSYSFEHIRPVPDPLKIAAIFIYTDPHDWGVPIQLVLDLLLSQRGILGTRSPLNNRTDLPNRGYQQDGQPPIFFSNPDLFWAAQYHLPRLGQGGFREALEGVWAAVTGGAVNGVYLQKQLFGKPYPVAFALAEKKLVEHRKKLTEMGRNVASKNELETVYMVGDNPESDIRGANHYESSRGTEWHSVLVKSGVYKGGQPAWKPKVIVEDVWSAIQYGAVRSARKPAEE